MAHWLQGEKLRSSGKGGKQVGLIWSLHGEKW
jgi:hypothetical protein